MPGIHAFGSNLNRIEDIKTGFDKAIDKGFYCATGVLEGFRVGLSTVQDVLPAIRLEVEGRLRNSILVAEAVLFRE